MSVCASVCPRNSLQLENYVSVDLRQVYRAIYVSNDIISMGSMGTDIHTVEVKVKWNKRMNGRYVFLIHGVRSI
jgi:hypothetical protein